MFSFRRELDYRTLNWLGYHYGSDTVALPNALTSSSISAEDAVRSWYRAWDVGRVVGPLAVNGAMIGFGVLAFLGITPLIRLLDNSYLIFS